MIKLLLNNVEVNVNHKRFPDMATGIEIQGQIPLRVEHAFIDARLGNVGSPNDLFFDIAQTVDVVRNINNRARIVLHLPYIPYARQDRRMTRNDSFSLKVFAKLLNMLQVDKVIAFDAHSDVSSMIDNLFIIGQERMMGISEVSHALTVNNPLIVAPDMGAVKKIHKVVSALTIAESPVIMDKEREPATGVIGNHQIISGADRIEGRNCLIVDDICDGGRTFISAASELIHNGAASVSLYVTHGIFSQGVTALFDGGISKIFTTDSIQGSVEMSDKVRVFECQRIINTLSGGVQ